VKAFNFVDSQSQAEEVVGHPVLLREIPEADDSADGQRDQIVGRKVVADDLSFGVIVSWTLGQAGMEVMERDQVGGYVLRHKNTLQYTIRIRVFFHCEPFFDVTPNYILFNFTLLFRSILKCLQ